MRAFYGSLEKGRRELPAGYPNGVADSLRQANATPIAGEYWITPERLRANGGQLLALRRVSKNPPLRIGLGMGVICPFSLLFSSGQGFAHSSIPRSHRANKLIYIFPCGPTLNTTSQITIQAPIQNAPPCPSSYVLKH